MSGKTLSAATTESLMPPNQAQSAAHTAPLGLCVVKYKCITTSVPLMYVSFFLKLSFCLYFQVVSLTHFLSVTYSRGKNY